MLGSLSDHEDHRPLQRKAPACGVWELSADDSTTVRLLRGDGIYQAGENGQLLDLTI